MEAIASFLPLLFMGGFAVFGLLSQDDDTTEPAFNQPEDLTFGDDDDEVALSPGYHGTVSTGAGNDEIVVDTGGPDHPAATLHFIADADDNQWFSPENDWIGDEALAHSGLTIIQPGDGDDAIRVNSGAVQVLDSEGADRIDLTGASAAKVYASDGDHIRGSDIALNEPYPHQILVHGSGAFTFEGGMADERVNATGDGATVYGGGGHDLLLGRGEGSSAFYGGDGDDEIFGARSHVWSWGSIDHTVGQDHAPDTLDGGAGNDKLYFAGGDLVTGGEGNDQLNGLLIQDQPYPRVTDFNPAEDTLQLDLQVDGARDSWAQDVSVHEENGNSFLTYRGETILELSGVTGLSYGFDFSDNHSEDGFFDSEGNQVNQDDFFKLDIWIR